MGLHKKPFILTTEKQKLVEDNFKLEIVMGRHRKPFRLTTEKQKLVEDNFKLVYYYLHLHCGKGKDVPICREDDLLSYLEERMCYAANTWDENGKAAFHTYAMVALRSGLMAYYTFSKKFYSRIRFIPFGRGRKDEENHEEPVYEEKLYDWEMIEELFEESELTLREREIISLRFRSRMVLNDIGKEYGICREMVRVIIKKGIGKMRKVIEENEYELDDFLFRKNKTL